MSNFDLDSKNIHELIHSIESGKYRLPCFQRDFKWNPPRIKSLLNSIQHNYPAGSLLFLSVDRDNPLIPSEPFKYLDEKDLKEKAEILVLDGQQRMTSCYSVFRNVGYYSYYLNFLKLMKDYNAGVKDFDFEDYIEHKRHSSTPMTELGNGLFPFAYLIDRKTMRDQIQIYNSGIQNDPSKSDICDFLNYKFGDIVDPILDYEFPIVELPEDSSMEAVCKVFQTINTTGLRLSVFDICVAVFMPKGINLKEMVKNSSKKCSNAKLLLDKDATSALQVVALLANKAPNTNTLATVLEDRDICDYWDDAIDGIEQTLVMFDGFGAGTKKNLSLLPYTPMVPIVAAVLARTKYADMDVPSQGKVEKKIEKYFFTSALSSRYTEGTNAKINDDFKSLNQWISNDIIPGMISHGVDWNTAKIIENNKNGAFGKAILCLLNNKNPKDFYHNKQVGVGESIESCDLHHIFPKAAYEGQYNDSINSVFNFTWLQKDTNNYIQDEKTKDYIDKIMIETGMSENSFKQLLTGHLIDNNLYKALKEEEYTNFISGRAECFKSILADLGVQFKEVNQDELEVEQDENEDDNEQ